MPRSRSRSRSRARRGTDEKHGDGRKEDKGDRKEGVAEAAKSGSSEQEIVSVAIRQLPGDIRERLEKLFEEGLLKEGDLDLRSITVFASLNEGLQARVMNHMENERIYVANARSKSGFLIATCDKAKTGCLDARGLGAIDPWRTALVAMATPKQKMVDLIPERDWLENHSEETIKIHVNVQSVESELGVPNVTVELPMSETSAAVKAKLVAMGVKSIPANKMKLYAEPVRFLKERHSFAFYNLSDGVTLTLSERKRAGVRFRSDHTAMPKRPRTQPQPGETSSPIDALQKLVGGQAPGKQPALPKLPALPGIGGMAPSGVHGLLGLPLPGLTMPGTAPAGTAPATAPSMIPGMKPPMAPGMFQLPGGLALPGAGTAPALSLANLASLGLTQSDGVGTELGKGLLQLPGLLPLGTSPATDASSTLLDVKAGLAKAAAPQLLMPGTDPKAAALAMMAMLGDKSGAKAPGLALDGDAKGNPLGLLMSDLAKAKSPLPGLPPPGADPKAAAIAMMAALNNEGGKAAPPGMAPALTMPPGIDPKSIPLLPPGGDPKAAALAMMAMMGDPTKAPPPSMPPTMGTMAKAAASIPDLGAPPRPADSKATSGYQSKAQMPSPSLSGAIPKFSMDNTGGPPLAQAFTAGTVQPNAPMGATAKSAGPGPA